MAHSLEHRVCAGVCRPRLGCALRELVPGGQSLPVEAWAAAALLLAQSRTCFVTAAVPEGSEWLGGKDRGASYERLLRLEPSSAVLS